MVEPSGSASFQELFSPERLDAFKKDPQRAALVKEFSKKLAKDPVFLASVEAVLREKGTDLKKLEISPKHLESFGWGVEGDMPSPAHAVAAVAAAVVPMAAEAAAVAV